ncbi:MAG: hypothetical protein U1G05_14625 [Kiritimatiellia bacterium]
MFERFFSSPLLSFTLAPLLMAGRVWASDYGDAPDTFRTTSASGGPVHLSGGVVRLGNQVDYESDGAPHAQALGDDLAGVLNDDDGITFTSRLLPGASACLQIVAPGGGASAPGSTLATTGSSVPTARAAGKASR